MNEDALREELDHEPFRPLRLHLASGKTVDILQPRIAWTLSDRLLVFRDAAIDREKAEGYDLISYSSIKRVELLRLGTEPRRRRKSG
jgi:hypothetical protein